MQIWLRIAVHWYFCVSCFSMLRELWDNLVGLEFYWLVCWSASFLEFCEITSLACRISFSRIAAKDKEYNMYVSGGKILYRYTFVLRLNVLVSLTKYLPSLIIFHWYLNAFKCFLCLKVFLVSINLELENLSLKSK